jgi:CubicO group peptidase (beta-lactamase class C family)
MNRKMRARSIIDGAAVAVSCRPMRRLFLTLTLAMFATACSERRTPTARADAGPPAASIEQRFAEGTLPPPVFVDPQRKTKLASAFPAVEKIFADWAEKAHIPGLAAGIIIDGELAWSKGYGVRDVTSTAPVDADTQFRIASMSKGFTAMAILKLRDKGELSLDEPAAKYYPELASLRYPTRDSRVITLRDLLSHSAGFPEDNPSGDRLLAMSDVDFAAWVRGGVPFAHTPGTDFEYSNLGFMVLGQVVTRVSGTTYEDFIRAAVLDPLGMRSTTYDVRATSPDHVATGYRRDGETWVAEPALGDGVGGAMGGLYSTVRDMARYVVFHLAAWPPRDEPETGPLRRSSAREMQQMARYAGLVAIAASTDKPGRVKAIGYGYGLGAYETCLFERVVSHSGGLPGFGSDVYWLPDYGVGLVAIANLTYADAGGPVRSAVEALLQTSGLVPRASRPAPALIDARNRTIQMLAHWDDEAVAMLVAGNFFLDKPVDAWKRDLEKLRAAHGECHSDGDLDAENALRGKWRMACERGWITMSITLAPTTPPRVQFLEAKDGFPPDARLTTAAERAVALTNRADDAPLVGGWIAEKVDRKALAKRAADARVARGRCSLDRVLDGDGKTRATFALQCARSAAKMTVAVDEAGRVDEVSFSGPDLPLGWCMQ